MADNTLEAFRQKFGSGAYNALIKHTQEMAKPKPLPRYLDKFLGDASSFESKAPAAKINRIRGSVDVPLNANGQRQAIETAKTVGNLDHIIASPLTRSKQTAVELARNSGAPITLTKELHPWRLGVFEGKPVDQVKDVLQELAEKHPNEKVPGRAAASTEDGESFNDFKKRSLGFLAPMMDAYAQQPDSRLGVVTHLRDIKLWDAFIKNKLRTDFSHEGLMKGGTDGQPPASVHKLSIGDDKQWKLDPVKGPEDAQGGGIYLIRHGETDFNGPEHSKGLS